MSSSPSSSSSSPLLLNKKLVSIDDCLSILDKFSSDTTSNTIDKENQPARRRVVFVDGSWHLGGERKGREEFEAGPRLPRARFFDIDEIAAEKGTEFNSKGLPHMMPSKSLFSCAMDALDIRNNDHVVIYTTSRCFSAARVFYTFRSMGHNPSLIHSMQGSIDEWITRGGPVETGPTTTPSLIELCSSATTTTTTSSSYDSVDAQHTVDMMEVWKTAVPISSNDDGSSSSPPSSLLLDARSEGRFLGIAPEPRENIRGGHIENSLNVPFLELLDDDDVTKFKSVDEMTEVFKRRGVVDVNSDQRIVCSCGSGVTACVLALALEECGRAEGKTVIYDGSWLEWGSDPETPIISAKE